MRFLVNHMWQALKEYAKVRISTSNHMLKREIWDKFNEIWDKFTETHQKISKFQKMKDVNFPQISQINV